MAQHQVLVFNASGQYVGDLSSSVVEFNYVKAANEKGFFRVTAPANEWPQEWRNLDYQYHFWRQPNNGNWTLDFVGFARDRFSDTQGGITTKSVEGFGANEWLDRRIVDATAGSAGGKKTDYLDDMMKAIVTENLGGGASDTRNFANRLNFTIAADLSLAPSVTKSFAYENVLETLQSLADTSAGQSSGAKDLYFDIVCTGYNSNDQPTFEFRTYIGQPGLDKTNNGATAGGIVFSLGNANIDNVHYERIFSNERNYVYAGGLGKEADRNVAELGNNARIGMSPINLREVFVSATHLDDANINEAVYEALNENRPTRKLSCTLLDTETTPYGIAWNWGDKVTVIYGQGRFDEVVRVVEVSVDRNKKETISAQFGFGATIQNPLSPLMKEVKKLQRDLKRQAGAGSEWATILGSGSTIPTTTELPRNNMAYLYDNGIVRRIYYNVGGTIRNVTLS